MIIVGIRTLGVVGVEMLEEVIGHHPRRISI